MIPEHDLSRRWWLAFNYFFMNKWCTVGCKKEVQTRISSIFPYLYVTTNFNLIFWCLVLLVFLSCLGGACVLLPCLAFHCLVLSCLVLPNPPYYRVLSSLVLSCLTLPRPPTPELLPSADVAPKEGQKCLQHQKVGVLSCLLSTCLCSPP